VTRRVLHALATALPEEGHDLLTGVEIRDVWGGAVLVRLHTAHERSVGVQPKVEDLRRAVQLALEGHRHRVEVAWTSLGFGL
jgi:hypothetical protein